MSLLCRWVITRPLVHHIASRLTLSSGKVNWCQVDGWTFCCTRSSAVAERLHHSLCPSVVSYNSVIHYSTPMSPRQGSPVPRELLPPHIGRCQSSATSIFQPPPSCRTTTSSQHSRPSGVLRHRSDGLECAAWRPPRPVAQCRQFPEEAKNASVSECTWTLRGFA